MRPSSGDGRRRSAITILERVTILMVTGTLVAVGYSAYRTHSARAQVANGLQTAHGLTPLVAHSFSKHREIRVDPEILAAIDEARASSALLDSITLVDGRIDLVFGDGADAAIAGRRVSLTPYETASFDVVWICGSAAPGPGLNPLGFAGGGRRAQPLPPTIEPRHLPRPCR